METEGHEPRARQHHYHSGMPKSAADAHRNAAARPGSRGGSRQAARQFAPSGLRPADLSPGRAPSRPSMDQGGMEFNGMNPWRTVDRKSVPSRQQQHQHQQLGGTARRGQDARGSLEAGVTPDSLGSSQRISALYGTSSRQGLTTPPAAALSRDPGMPTFGSPLPMPPPSRGGTTSLDRPAETWDARVPASTMRSSLNWGSGPSTYEVDGRPGTRGGGASFELDGRPATRSGGQRPPSRMLGSQTLGPAQLAPLTSMAGLFASSAPSSTPLAGARRPVADAQGARTGPATRERPAEASLRASLSFGSNSLRQRTAPAAAVEDDIDKLLEGLGDEDGEGPDPSCLDDLQHYLSTLDQSEGRSGRAAGKGRKGGQGQGGSKAAASGGQEGARTQPRPGAGQQGAQRGGGGAANGALLGHSKVPGLELAADRQALPPKLALDASLQKQLAALQSPAATPRGSAATALPGQASAAPKAGADLASGRPKQAEGGDAASVFQAADLKPSSRQGGNRRQQARPASRPPSMPSCGSPLPAPPRTSPGAFAHGPDSPSSAGSRAVQSLSVA